MIWALSFGLGPGPLYPGIRGAAAAATMCVLARSFVVGDWCWQRYYGGLAAAAGLVVLLALLVGAALGWLAYAYASWGLA